MRSSLTSTSVRQHEPPAFARDTRVRQTPGVKDRRVALVGYGMAGREFHAPLLREVDGLRLTHVVTGDADRAAAAEAENPGVRVVATLDELWADAHHLDLVVIASPTSAHVTQARDALRRELAVVVDKPLAVTAAEGRELTELAAARGAMLTVFQNRRWAPAHLTARGLRAAGVLGEVVRYEARYERWRPVPKTRWREQTTSERGGGLLMDLQSHLVDGALDLFGPVASVYAELDSLTTVGDDVTFLALRHVSGVTSHLGATSLAGAPGPGTRLIGRKSTYLLADVGGDLTAYDARRDADDEHRGFLVRGDESEPVERARGSWADFYRGVREALVEGSPPPVDPTEAVAVLEVLDAARVSARDAMVVDLGSDLD
jgi:predicted dehydrogenase